MKIAARSPAQSTQQPQAQQSQAQLRQLQQQLQEMQRRQTIINNGNQKIQNLQNTRDALNGLVGAVGNIVKQQMEENAARDAAKRAQQQQDDLQQQIDEILFCISSGNAEQNRLAGLSLAPGTSSPERSPLRRAAAHNSCPGERIHEMDPTPILVRIGKYACWL
jgi:DNA repair exonuclease SbcCD ATPase subunit